ncbi:nuclear transport factor 2 family protein [Spirosoma gilvum]
MKFQFFLLALLFSSTATFAQTLEQSFSTMMAEYKQNPYAFMQARMAPDVRFIAGHNGEFMDIHKLITPDQKVEDAQWSDLKFFESGDLGVVSGIRTTRYANPKGAALTYKDAFTYTYKKQNNDWKVVAMQHTKMEYK